MKRRTAYNILLTLGFYLVLVLGIKACIEMPMVFISHSTASCVEVWDKNGEFSCDNLPPRYETVWRK